MKCSVAVKFFAVLNNTILLFCSSAYGTFIPGLDVTLPVLMIFSAADLMGAIDAILVPAVRYKPRAKEMNRKDSYERSLILSRIDRSVT
jgi:uncharacterized protein involved in cysteine biosynthesis